MRQGPKRGAQYQPKSRFVLQSGGARLGGYTPAIGALAFNRSILRRLNLDRQQLGGTPDMCVTLFLGYSGTVTPTRPARRVN